jgi:hypothetical protein
MPSESKRVGEILKGLRLGDANPKGSPDTVDIDSIPDKLYDTQVDTSVVAILVALSLLFLAQQYEHDGMFLITILIN